jgi:succinoglycan biosynthesis transport protein ExoP
MGIIERFPSLFTREPFYPLARTKNWRLFIFAIVFLLVAVGGLFYVYSRPAEYRAGARLEITPAEKLPGDANAPAAATTESASAFLTEVQLLTARPSLEELAARIRRVGFADLLSGPDPVLSLQNMLSVNPVQGTHVVQLWAVGGKPELLPFVLNELTSIYEARVGERFVGMSTEAADQARDEVDKYKAAILQKRAEMEAFRIQYGIVSQERDENEVTARAKGLNNAVTVAEEKAMTAQTRLRSLKSAIAEGKAAIRAKDNPTLAAMEQRLSQAREELKQMERRYTPAYLAREPQAVALKTKIPELEDQIRREREASQQANLAEAEQEAAQTQDALNRLRKQLSGDKQTIQAFSARLSEYAALQTQLETLERLQHGAAERLVRIDASETARKPKVQLIQSANVPREPWRPNYTRDAGIVILSALVLAWLSSWLVDFLLHRETGPTVIVASTPIAYPVNVTELAPLSQPILGTPPPVSRLPSPQHVLRELQDAELTALLDAADDESRVALMALLSGVTPEELIELTWNDVDLDTSTIRIPRPMPRAILVGSEIAGLFAAIKQQRRAEADDRLLGGASGTSSLISHLEAVVSYAAHDAGLDQAAEITPNVIRHTFIAFLVRQGIRFSELARVVGPLPAGVTAAYGAIVPTVTRRPLDETDRVIPALRGLAKTLGTSDKA